ncbi:hypothetical protein KUH03_35920 [Sphingobacterium sp. E70]|uniref:hypothetical protein n=1 Tax=Sphingobacterium sp. E70 TaxID=2853439 RepID=UPI00211CE326|nr:hypothetical protein [Sphingobacterium sp. E70]ULT24347.1 hypothetical protein KUH03_35920 [Sphingobacterium sp. E70]
MRIAALIDDIKIYMMKPKKNKSLLLSIIIILVSAWGTVYAQSGGGKLHAVVVGQDNSPLGAASISLLRSPGIFR